MKANVCTTDPVALPTEEEEKNKDTVRLTVRLPHAFFASSTSKFRQKQAEMQKKKQKMHVRFQVMQKRQT